jgi:hypothetical protein
MILGALASVLAAAWKFLGIRPPDHREATLNALYALPRRIRAAPGDAELCAIEQEVDDLLSAQLAKTMRNDEDALEMATLVSSAQRLDNLIHHRRSALARAPFSAAPHSSIESET